MATSSGLVFTLTLLATCVLSGFCWDSDDFELFDLVEEVNANFYEVLEIDQSATTSEVRKAYRRASLLYHPDKNDAENAEEKFRQIVAIYEVLKDAQKREKYNQVLVEGLPDWRQPVYYYRRARKMGLYELAMVLAVIITIGQYFVAWGIYIERRLVLEEVLSTKKKKEKKKKKQVTSETDVVEEEELQSIPFPRVLDLWPFQLSVFLFYSVYNLPDTVKEWQEERKRRKEEAEEEERARALELEAEPEEVTRKPKKRAPTELPEYSNEMYASVQSSMNRTSSQADVKEKPNSQLKKGEWTDEELVFLSKAVNKFPGGTPQRWEKIADMVGRSVSEVTAKVKGTKGSYSVNVSSTVQSSGYHADSSGLIKDEIISQQDNSTREFEVDNKANQEVRRRQQPTKVPKTGESSEKSKTVSVPRTAAVPDGAEDAAAWTQNQQTIFEWALKQYPKGTDKRWDRVSEHIPGKTKEDCVARFKLLAELISKKKKMVQGGQER
ncbi:dnaJ homolog subfamily C member 1 [Aplysia californica]|uniref:DnaJ homolog subfamily C member 1 n=1 Tax=Aplysia californica TaxID=6500 RepID=A0ABM0K430_APLCA|nr:dnaJ homolog subfamily C member 1 [Aplysia californica]